MSGTILLDKTRESSHNDVACDPESESSCSTSAETTTTATRLPPELSSGCGYNCSRHIYAKIRTRQWYEELTMEQREMIKTEYYQSYDYMTGLRTAASLGGTIMLFSLFILYKMKCRHGRHRTKNIVLDGATAVSDIDIEKEAGYHQNGNTGLLGEKAAHAAAANNVGSRRSSRVVLMPEDFQFLTRQDHRRLSIATSSRSDGSRMSCGAIPSFGHGGLSSGDRLPSSYSIVSQHPHTPLLSAFPPGVQQPRFSADLDARLLRPDLAVEPIDIHIIQPTPNVSPCGSVRRLSEDVVALTGCRSKEFSPVSIPLLSIPKPYQSKSKCKPRRSSLSKRDRRACPHMFTVDAVSREACGPAPIASTSSASTSGDNLRPCSEEAGELKFIDCSDSDAVSFSSDSDVSFLSESELGSPPTPQCDFVHEVLRSTSPAIERAQINSDGAETDEESSVSETRC